MSPADVASLTSSRVHPLRANILLDRIVPTYILLLAALTLSCWLLSGFGLHPPPDLLRMKGNNSLMAVLCSVGAMLVVPPQRTPFVLFGRLLGLFVAVFAIIILLQDAHVIHIGIDTLLALEPGSLTPGASKLNTPRRQTKRPLLTSLHRPRPLPRLRPSE